MIELVRDLYYLFKHRKKYWLFPIVLVLVTFATVVIATQGSVVAPFIYSIF